MHFHELRFLEFAKWWWWQRGMILENSTRAGTKQAVQRPASLLRAPGASQPSLSLTWHQLGLLPSSKGNFFYIPAYRKAGRAAGGKANLGEGGFLLGVGRVVLLSLQSNTLTDTEQ